MTGFLFEDLIIDLTGLLSLFLWKQPGSDISLRPVSRVTTICTQVWLSPKPALFHHIQLPPQRIHWVCGWESFIAPKITPYLLPPYHILWHEGNHFGKVCERSPGVTSRKPLINHGKFLFHWGKQSLVNKSMLCLFKVTFVISCHVFSTRYIYRRERLRMIAMYGWGTCIMEVWAKKGKDCIKNVSYLPTGRGVHDIFLSGKKK